MAICFVHGVPFQDRGKNAASSSITKPQCPQFPSTNRIISSQNYSLSKIIMLKSFKFLTCWLSLRVCASKFWDGRSSFSLPRVSFNDLVYPSATTRDTLNKALTNIGCLEIVGIPNFAASRHSALEPLSSCMDEDSHSLSMVMNDGSSRKTIDAFDESGLRGEFVSSCADKAVGLRDAVDLATRQLFQSLDLLSKSNEALLSPYKSYSDVLAHGDHLEHLHTYYGSDTLQTSPKKDLATIDFHVDAGLMIAMTSGFYGGSPPSPDSGLYIELSDGEVVKVFPSDDSLIIMIGEGGAKWLSSNTKKSFRAVPHALYADLKDKDSTRSWYGKMILPPSDAIIPQEGITYNEYRALQQQMVHSHSDEMTLLPSACTSFKTQAINGRRLASSVTCTVSSSGQAGILCWMQCVSVSTLSCSNSDAVCYDSTNKKAIGGNQMCMGCSPKCSADLPVVKSNSSSSSDDYCVGTGTTMLMDGFAGIGTSDKGETLCINFLFIDWTLDEPVKFAFACIGTLLAGILVQSLLKLRLWLTKKPPSAIPKIALNLILVLLFGIQVTFGYFLMLIAMTYSIELFCMVCIGLTLGFALFHLSETSHDTSEPCCNDIIPAKEVVSGGESKI